MVFAVHCQRFGCFAARIALIACFVFAGIQLSTSVQAQDFETKAPYAFLLDVETGSVLLDKKSKEPMPPSSMVKLMTMAVVFDMLKEGRISITDEFLISEDAWRRGGAVSGGSTMFAELNSKIALSDLIPGVVVQSGNDASIAIAEGLAGSESGFSRLMNAKAQEIGLTGSNFTNATGLPDPEMHVTARDLAKLALYIIKEHPTYYSYYSMEDFTWNGVRQRNRNPLLGMGIGADGLKTGHTAEAGYGLVGSAVQDGRRLILVINGLSSMRDRREEARKLLLWGFRAFDKATLFDAGETAGYVSVFGGMQGRLPVAGKGPIHLLVPKGAQPDLRARIVYQGPVDAPVEKGARIASLHVYDGDSELLSVPLYAQEDVDVGPLHKRALDSALALLKQLWRQYF
ncbi:MAG: D-alanyl-D-alanine carboxypeptidase family protein [Tepidamorphaceae bacterium]|nr:D-alanyl-D-alanine carboxypeptidase [Rhodobiaceae bacterium]MCC0049350.1 D-alanyl-D-alanine carboxypeptidase [Rhodobiaceae bacterium]